MLRTLGIYLSFLLLFTCCNQRAVPAAPTDTPTAGEVNVAVDESFRLLFDTEVYTFESLYPNAHVPIRYLAAQDALHALLVDSVKVILLDRTLTKAEKAVFAAQNIYPIETKVLADAVAFVIHPLNLDSNLTVDAIKGLIGGGRLETAHGVKEMNVVFDCSNGANENYLKAQLAPHASLGKNCFAVHSNPEVVDYVSTHANAIGVISVNWISDQKDSTCMALRSKIRIVGVGNEVGKTAKIEKSGKEVTPSFYKPCQAFIKTKDYPFCRDVYMINRQTRAGLGMGFVSFVAGDVGQRIILKMGLVPAIAPTRMVEISH